MYIYIYKQKLGTPKTKMSKKIVILLSLKKLKT